MSKEIIKFFPEASEVFYDRIEEHSKVLFPLHTLDLNQINEEWTGVIHTLKYNEDPYNKATVSAFTDYCEDCIIGFKIIDGKYSFMSDLKYFDRSPDWEEWFDATKKSFETDKKKILKKGILLALTKLEVNLNGFKANGYQKTLTETQWTSFATFMMKVKTLIYFTVIYTKSRYFYIRQLKSFLIDWVTSNLTLSLVDTTSDNKNASY